MPQLTHEQRAVVDSDAALLAVDAFAGSGKTSTLVEYAQARPRARILYLAFNKSVATDARDRFPDNVDCRTTHSLAYSVEGRKFRDKLGNLRAYEVAQECRCNPRRAKAILATLSAWLCSCDPNIEVSHVDPDSVEDEVDAAAVVDQARALWAKMLDPRSSLKMPHDGYLKLWALSKPRLRYDIILLDEAQDTNPLTLELVLAQREATIVLVGDRHQGIYGFRRAMNAMEAVDAKERIALTQSFRFGQAIAEVATALLKTFKGEDHAVTGREDIDVRWAVDRSRHYAVIARTNAGLFDRAARIVTSQADPRLHFVGGFDGYLFGKVLDAYYLWADRRSMISDASVLRFENFAAMRSYGEEAGDAEVNALVKTVEAYKSEVPSIFHALKAAESPNQNQAQVTLTTAHKAKGLEWEQVELGDDFIELPPEDDDFDPEEINLLYVAVTRAVRAVQLPSSLCEWLRSIGTAAHCDGRQQEAVSAVTRVVDLGKADRASAQSDPERTVRAWLAAHAHRFSEATARELLAVLDEVEPTADVVA